MIALCVDDEKLLLDTLIWAVRQSPNIESAVGFDDELDALEWAENNRPDVAFLDVRMHTMGGMELAEKLKSLHPGLHIIFCTGYREYALDAFELHASGYLMKPISPEKVQKEIDHIRGSAKSKALLTAHCFGSFEVYANGAPLRFKRTKTKELFAYLIDRRGSVIRSRELCSVLWKDYDEKYLNYLHQLFGDLRKGLADVGAESVLRSMPQGYSVETAYIDCDYYRFLQGDPEALRRFTGEYMSCYDWGSSTCSYLISKM